MSRKTRSIKGVRGVSLACSECSSQNCSIIQSTSCPRLSMCCCAACWSAPTPDQRWYSMSPAMALCEDTKPASPLLSLTSCDVATLSALRCPAGNASVVLIAIRTGTGGNGRTLTVRPTLASSFFDSRNVGSACCIAHARGPTAPRLWRRFSCLAPQSQPYPCRQSPRAAHMCPISSVGQSAGLMSLMPWVRVPHGAF